VTLRVVTRPLDDARPLLDLAPVDDTLAWVRRDEGLVAWGQAARLRPGPGGERILRADGWLRSMPAEIDDAVGLPGTGLVALGSFSFAPGSADSVLVVPRRVVGRRDGRTFLTRIDPVDGTADPVAEPGAHPSRATARDRPRYAGSTVPDLQWLEAVAEAVRRIRGGELEKVVLARDHALWARERFDPVELARRLTLRFPSCHTFVVDGLVGATPELLLARSGPHVTSRVLAGTAARDPDEVTDAALGAGLLESDKDRWEHRLAADSVAEVLAPRCSSLSHEAGPRLLRLDNVQHLATTFTGELASEAASLELVHELHPTAAVGGTPRSTALALIDELEGMDRGRYAGPVGWTTRDGDGEWGIALRCAELAGARARLFAGVGVVAASLPEAELEETRLKLLAMQAALGADPSV
jgi:menaquinone-specific isochorismate synthase